MLPGNHRSDFSATTRQNECHINFRRVRKLELEPPCAVGVDVVGPCPKTVASPLRVPTTIKTSILATPELSASGVFFPQVTYREWYAAPMECQVCVNHRNFA